MLRFLLCASCCGAPPNNQRSAKAKLVELQRSERDTNEKDSDDKDQIQSKVGVGGNKDLVSLNEKEALLSKQIQANNGNYGANIDASNSQGKNLSLDRNIEPLGSSESNNAHLSTTRVEDVDGGSMNASTSGQLQRQDGFDGETVEIDSTGTGYKGAPKSISLTYDDDQSISSIDVDQFTESPGNSTRLQTKLLSHETNKARSTTLDDTTPVNDGAQRLASYESGAMFASTNIPSTTKIGDYARLEYSPVEDLESVTTMSQSRGGSEKGTRSNAGSTLSRQNSLKVNANTNENISRRSSRGGNESTSISIASQLSNEQLQQNITNMLESANSSIPMFGTIGLPLGPPLEGTLNDETAKTSPETTGAALTSASQDSLSDASLGTDRQATMLSNATSTGAALVGESTERSAFEDSTNVDMAPLASGEEDQSNPVIKLPISVYSTSSQPGRVGSPQSLTTTTSGGMTNPTPTPSELSGGSTKKRKLKAKSLLKRLRPGGGSSKKKNKETQE